MIVTVSGGEKLAAVGKRLSAAGTGGKLLRRNMRRNIVAAVKPMQAAVKGNIAAIPARTIGDPPLRAAMVRATKIRIRTSGPNAVVRLWVAPDSMPKGREGLPAKMEGDSPWRRPVYGHRDRWVDQSAHPYFKRAVQPRLVGVRAACLAAVKETAASI